MLMERTWWSVRIVGRSEVYIVNYGLNSLSCSCVASALVKKNEASIFSYENYHAPL